VLQPWQRREQATFIHLLTALHEAEAWLRPSERPQADAHVAEKTGTLTYSRRDAGGSPSWLAAGENPEAEAEQLTATVGGWHEPAA
jgi:hypothetical protein